MRLLPTDTRYYDLLDDLAAKAHEASRLLSSLVAAPDRLKEWVGQIKDVEHDADKISESISERLDKTFVTPVDREDIHLLASRLDNVVDLVDGTARRFLVFGVERVPEDAKPLVDVLVRAAAKLESAVSEMRKPKLLAAELRTIKQYEEEGDALYEKALTSLFASRPDPIHAITWKEIYDRIEDAIDECQHVGQVLASIALKNS